MKANKMFLSAASFALAISMVTPTFAATNENNYVINNVAVKKISQDMGIDIIDLNCINTNKPFVLEKNLLTKMVIMA